MSRERSIAVDVDEGTATITITRPDRMNALDRTAAAEFIAAVDRLDHDTTTRALVITGEGRAFCAGFDISDGADAFAQSGAARGGSNIPAEITGRLLSCSVPVVAAVNGPAVGLGATMLTAVDIRIGTPAARLGFSYVRLGMVPEGGTSWLLPRLVGMGTALEWTLSGELVEAPAALSAGFYQRMVEQDELLGATGAFVGRLVQRTSPVAVAHTRRLMWQSLSLRDPMEAARLEWAVTCERATSADGREGAAAFKERRDPKFGERMPPHGDERYVAGPDTAGRAE